MPLNSRTFRSCSIPSGSDSGRLRHSGLVHNRHIRTTGTAVHDPILAIPLLLVGFSSWASPHGRDHLARYLSLNSPPTICLAQNLADLV
ncbi:hypothetical protein A4X06_0g5765 [Tilletia controversa]|uniref:Uncharacterized protein n=1 Tax=Tilletia controversa TaxID=13291 RepID=A0A8X7SVE1_9BASI|nr:hypothetical protein CF336_g9156 [Tilletia laevis]KAE8181343.1 hypothetical protein CF335_g8967 [Tilletia laevis]KAE8181534.1 hypothetical protein CF328_g8810 [Tilletia controversa]KAE8245249.1 hypothetical protein A4X06_0g5765 [Tilletia controversa]